MNYSQLSTLIQEYCESTEQSFVSNIPTFVQLAEERVYNTVQIPAIRKNATATMSIGNKYMTLPHTFSAQREHPGILPAGPGHV